MRSRARLVRSRARATRLLLVAVLALSTPLAVAAPALAASFEGGQSFNELSRKAEEAGAETTPTTTTSPTENHINSQPTNSGKTLVIVLGAAVVLLSAIAFVIVRDARRVAPAGDGDLIDVGAPGRTVRQRKRRAKAKAARQQRKRNR